MSVSVSDAAVLQGVTLAIAILGTLLGVINTWHSLNQSKAKLRVRFLNNYALPGVKHVGYCVEVTNLSSFPMTIREVGFLMSPFWVRKFQRAMVTPISNFGDPLPCRIEPRQQANIYLPLDMGGQTNKRIRAAYAKTDCGLYFRDRSRALLDAADRLQS